MHGIGTSTGAITILNALGTGVGCAVAISLPVRAELELRRSTGLSANRIQVERGQATALVQESLEAGLARYGPGACYSGELRIDSQVPVAKGLKSSSAVAGAVLRAVAHALRGRRPPEEIARIAADVAQQIGLSATGAFDDCLAALRGGLALTDNATRGVLQSPPFDTGLEAALWIPPQRHRPSPDYQSLFRARSAEAARAAEWARNGRWAEAMALNSELVESIMGYDYGALRADLLGHHAMMCGVSGMGPTLAALAPRGRGAELLARFPPGIGELRVVPVRPADASAEGAT